MTASAGPPPVTRETFLATYAAAERVVRALPARAAFTAATDLGEILRGLAERAADLRAVCAARVAREDDNRRPRPHPLTVRDVAAQLDMSRSNAGELLARGERVEEEARTAPSVSPSARAARMAARRVTLDIEKAPPVA